MVNGKNMIFKRIEDLKGDASHRKFFRKYYDKNFTTILVEAKKEKFKNLEMYMAINEFLLKNKIKTPRLISENLKKNFIEIEDFGNISYDKIIKKKISKIGIYKELVNLLINIQKIKTKKKILFKGKKYFLNIYTIRKLNKESDLFFNWYLPLILKGKKSIKLKKIIKKKLNNLYKKIKLKNNVFTHRDFHASNLMKVKKKIGVIDTQDALLGNPSYDLVSLIDDVRVKTSSKEKKQIFDYYFKKCFSTYKKNKESFIHDFKIIAVQRNLKIIGIFARLFKRDKKAKYLKLIPYTWKLLDLRLRDPMFDDIKNKLDENITSQMKKKIKIL